MQLAVRLALLALLVYWSYVVVRPFVPILTWSVVLTVAFYPVFTWLSAILGDRPKAAATILTLINLAVVIGPAAWLGLGAVEELGNFAAHLSAGTLSVPSPPASVKDWPVIGHQLYSLWEQASTNLRALLVQLAPQLKPMARTVLDFAGDAGVGTLKFLIAVALSGFLFPAGPRLVAAARSFLSRVVAERSQDFLALAGATIRSVAQGVIGIAVAQALVIGIILKLADVPQAGLLAIVVLMLCILQITAFVVVIPVLIWVWATKSTVAAILITLCLLPASLADNVVRPVVMGRGLVTPVLVVNLGVLGGTLADGIVGLFIGPIILAVAWELVTAWVREDEVKAVPDEADSDRRDISAVVGGT